MKIRLQNWRLADTRRNWRILLAVPIALILLAWAAAQFLIVEKPLAQAEAIVVLGGGATFVERTAKAAEIYRGGRASKIILTNDGERGGWSRTERRNPYFWELAERELLKQGVAAEAIEVLPEAVGSTRDEAVLLADAARERGWRNVLLVTSGYHARRALWTFERAAIEKEASVEFGVEAPPVGRQTPHAFLWWTSARGWEMVAGEYLKFGYYWLFY